MKKTILINGATGSIGSAATIELANQNCNLILLGKDESRLNKLILEINRAKPLVELDKIVLDLSETESVLQACHKIKKNHRILNGIINTAAIFEPTRKVNSVGMELMFATNHLGPFQLTISLLELMHAAPWARIMNIASPNQTKLNFADLEFEHKFSALKAYESSKTAQLLSTFKLAQMVSWTFVSVFAFDPGIVKSDIHKNQPLLKKILLNNISKRPDSISKAISHYMLNSFEETLNAKIVKSNGTVTSPNNYFMRVNSLNQLWEISLELSECEFVAK